MGQKHDNRIREIRSELDLWGKRTLKTHPTMRKRSLPRSKRISSMACTDGGQGTSPHQKAIRKAQSRTLNERGARVEDENAGVISQNPEEQGTAREGSAYDHTGKSLREMKDGGSGLVLEAGKGKMGGQEELQATKRKNLNCLRKTAKE